MDDDVRRTAAKAVVDKYNDLMTQRADALRRRSDIDREIRGFDRALFDCRAAGRLFGVDIALPEDVKPAMIVRPPNSNRLASMWRPSEKAPSLFEDAAPRIVGTAAIPNPAPPAPPVPTVASTTLTAGAEPSIRDLILLYLKQAGAKGEKASLMRRKVETFLNRQIHYKTIGMSLYRLSKETPPMVRREGQTWFLVPSAAEAKDPGAATPGSLEGR
ncbi:MULTISPECIES: hypothetical protein [unclassified Bradyrhizobium]|uniref:hypothetical protein n=1 Tax=unclassified Bradyrhizobium TaxID=2631580 RepID=UPI00070CDCDD|nr:MULTISPECIES: hypothetical protein [unclassified Bradyrhizobium]KQT05932.1 hypothetical protein ASG57_11125 [Bradyrhizobium sp. Leaf396]